MLHHEVLIGELGSVDGLATSALGDDIRHESLRDAANAAVGTAGREGDNVR